MSDAAFVIPDSPEGALGGLFLAPDSPEEYLDDFVAKEPGGHQRSWGERLVYDAGCCYGLGKSSDIPMSM
jgi:hypothetical protein